MQNGDFVARQAPAQPPQPIDSDEEAPPPPEDGDAPPEDPFQPSAPAPSQTPVGFWSDLCGEIRKELKPPIIGFFAATPSAPVQGVLSGNTLELRCANDFTAKMLDKPELLEVVARKASMLLGHPVQAVAVDGSAGPGGNPRLEQLMSFGRQYSDIVTIKEY